MTLPRLRVWVPAVCAATILVGGDALVFAAERPCGPGVPSLSERVIGNSETPLPLDAWADLTDGKGAGTFAAVGEGAAYGRMEVRSITHIRHGDLDGDGDRDAVGVVSAQGTDANVSGVDDNPALASALLVVWRNDDGRAVPMGSWATGFEPGDLDVAVDRGLITFTFSTLADYFGEGVAPRVTAKVFLRMRGPSVLTEVADPDAKPVDLGPFAVSRVGHGRSVDVEPDGTWVYTARTYQEPPAPEQVSFSGRVVARSGNTATVTFDGEAGTTTWTYDEVNDTVAMKFLPATSGPSNDGIELCGPRSPAGWCGG